LDKSLVEEYGRPAMIFLAVAAPTPGRSSRSFSLALFRSTFVPLACPPNPELASALAENANAPIVKNIAMILNVFLTVPPVLPQWLPAIFTLPEMEMIETAHVGRRIACHNRSSDTPPDAT
jgi:hypothetical protein